jgi:hypothetical protein
MSTMLPRTLEYVRSGRALHRRREGHPHVRGSDGVFVCALRASLVPAALRYGDFGLEEGQEEDLQV